MSNSTAESIKMKFQQNVASDGSQDTTAEPSAAEWQVLYTTQLTQKSKKYHDGFLQLAICGSHGRQAVLLDATKTILHSRFLRKDEIVKTDLSLKFDAYLIDIGELEGTQATDSTTLGNICNVVEKTEKIPRQKNSFSLKSNTLEGKPLKNACLKKDSESNFSSSKVDTEKSSGIVPKNKPLRDASQILCFLQKPRIEKSKTSCHTENKMTPTERPLLTNVADLAFAENYHPLNLKSLARPDQSGENVDATKLTEHTEFDMPHDTNTRTSTAIPASINSSSQLRVDAHNANSNQQLFSEMEDDTQCHDAGNATDMESFPASQSHGLVDVKNPFEDISSSREMDEFPSFDLGF